MIQRILVALDGSKNSIRALRNAIQIANQTESLIIGILVIQSFPTGMGLMKTRTGKEVSKHSKQIMQTAKAMCARKRVKFFETVEYGEEGKTIVSFAQKNEIDLIAIGSRGMGKVGEIFLGSTSNYVVHSSKIPVLIVK